MTLLRRFHHLVCFLPGIMFGAAGSPLGPSAVDALLSARLHDLGGEETGIGLVVAILEPAGERIKAVGRYQAGVARAPDERTIFEIGSVTKVFTALLLADAVEHGLVRLDEPLLASLPAGRTEVGATPVGPTWRDVALHCGGFPFMPPRSPPLATTDDLVAWLRRSPASATPRKWEYSNVGYWALGEGLAARRGQPFRRALFERVLQPLGLRDAGFDAVAPDRRAEGHNAALGPAEPFARMPGYGGMDAAGGLMASTEDLLRLLRSALHRSTSPLTSSLDLTLSVRATVSATEQQALGWTILQHDGEEIVYRDGGTLGFAACVAFVPARNCGAVVLSNQPTSVRDLALHLLVPDLPLNHPRLIRRIPVVIPATTLAQCVGDYFAEGEGRFSVTPRGDGLRLALPDDWGLAPVDLYAEGPSDFFGATVGVLVHVERDDLGEAKAIKVTPPQGQRPVVARRVKE